MRNWEPERLIKVTNLFFFFGIWIAVDGFLLLSILLQRHRLRLWLRSRCCFFDFFLFLVILRLLVLVVGLLWLLGLTLQLVLGGAPVAGAGAVARVIALE